MPEVDLASLHCIERAWGLSSLLGGLADAVDVACIVPMIAGGEVENEQVIGADDIRQRNLSASCSHSRTPEVGLANTAGTH
jgi:hypothetical protein